MKSISIVCFALISLGSLFFTSESALACAVCGVANESQRQAFIWTTVLLSGIPLGFIGWVVYAVLGRRSKENAVLDAPASDEKDLGFWE